LDLIVAASKIFLDPKMAYAYILVVIFLLLYLIRPKPRYEVMPSLMFLFKDLGRNRSANFLRQLITNFLFLLQLLLIIAIVTSAAKPFTDVSRVALFRSTVIVLDTSASMKAPYEGQTRFEKAVSLAKENLGSVNTLILVKKVPDAVLLEESAAKAKSYLDKLQPTDGPTSLYSAISAAGSYAKENARVVVISDFIDTSIDSGLDTIKKTLESQGIKVDYIPLNSQVPNVGIVDLTPSESKTTAVIKNYNGEPAVVKMTVNSLTEELNISANSREVFTFTTPARTSKLELEVVSGRDAFPDDNVAYISAPSGTTKKILLITNSNNYKSYFIYNAFDVMKNVQVDVAIPPKIPALGGYDAYIFKDVDPNLILPGTFKGVKAEVEERGKAAIMMAQADFLAVDYQGLIPVIPTELAETTTSILPASGTDLTADIEIGVTKKYFKTKPIEGRAVADIANAEDGSSIITFNKLGSGATIYYGIMDEDKASEAFFAKSPGYFVFWKRTLDLITNTPSIKNLNYKTGSYISFAEQQRIETPQGIVTTKELSLDNQGLYTLKDRTIAINLADERESDISANETIAKDTLSQSSDRFNEKVPYELTDYFIYAALAIIFIELLYIKFRGDF
jgi:hypothetical protein